jgi:hypothetical protein
MLNRHTQVLLNPNEWKERGSAFFEVGNAVADGDREILA